VTVLLVAVTALGGGAGRVTLGGPSFAIDLGKSIPSAAPEDEQDALCRWGLGQASPCWTLQPIQGYNSNGDRPLLHETLGQGCLPGQRVGTGKATPTPPPSQTQPWLVGFARDEGILCISFIFRFILIKLT
jgi:hypothetical protein